MFGVSSSIFCLGGGGRTRCGILYHSHFLVAASLIELYFRGEGED